MFVAESDNIMNMNNTTTSNGGSNGGGYNNNGNTSPPMNHHHHSHQNQAISLIKDFNNFNQNSIETNMSLNQQIISTSSKLLSIGRSIKKQQLLPTSSKPAAPPNDDDEVTQEKNHDEVPPPPSSSSNGNILDDDVLQVNCNSIVALLHKKKFGSGGKGKCILVDNNKWMTPIEFEQHCGKGNCRDWKRTIKCGGQQLLTLLDNNVILCHAVSCSCSVCSNDSNVVGPIRPFLRYRRRKRDEIMAQNAYKKFLSLKPPTLMTTNDFDRLHSQANLLLNSLNGANSSVSGLLSGSAAGSSGNNNNNYMIAEDEVLESTISSTNSDYNSEHHHSHHHRHHNHNGDCNNQQLDITTGGSNSINNQINNSHDYNNEKLENNNNNNHIEYQNNCNYKLSNSLKQMEKLETKQWDLLERAADILIQQSQNLKDLIQQAQNQSKMTKRCLIREIRQQQPGGGAAFNHQQHNDGYADSSEIGDDDEDIDEDDDDEIENYNNNDHGDRILQQHIHYAVNGRYSSNSNNSSSNKRAGQQQQQQHQPQSKKSFNVYD